MLVKDYSLNCATEKHRAFQVISAAYVVFVALGIPIFMATLMVRRMREYRGGSGTDRFVARRVADELKLDDAVAADAIRDCNTGREYRWGHRWFKLMRLSDGSQKGALLEFGFLRVAASSSTLSSRGTTTVSVELILLKKHLASPRCACPVLVPIVSALCARLSCCLSASNANGVVASHRGGLRHGATQRAAICRLDLCI